MFYRMLSHKNIKYYLKKKYKFSEKDLDKYNSIIYTGPIDAFLILNMVDLIGDPLDLIL